MMINQKYIPKSALHHLHKFQYTSGGVGTLDKYLDKWWTFAASLLPNTAVPNVITLAGFIATTFVFILTCILMTWDIDNTVKGYIYVTIAALLFSYQTLDAVDGKHARRIGASSPVGKLFDHGCDAVSTMCIAFGFSQLCGMNQFHTNLLYAMTQTLGFYSVWYDVHMQIFRCSLGYFGVTEAQIYIMSLYLIEAIFGVGTLSTELRYMLPNTIQEQPWTQTMTLTIQGTTFIIFILMFIFMILSDLCKERKRLSKINLAKYQFLGWVVHISFFLLFSSTAPQNFGILTFIASVLNGCTLILRLMVSSVCNFDCSPIHLPLLPYYAISLIYFWTYHETQSTTSIGFSVTLLLILILFNIFYLSIFIHNCLTDMCTELGIKMFSNKKTQQSMKKIK